MNFEAFRTLAEVATGLTGFVGVILAIRSQTDPLPRLQLVGFLQNSLAVLIFSLLPEFLIETFGHAILAMRVLCCVGCRQLRPKRQAGPSTLQVYADL